MTSVIDAMLAGVTGGVPVLSLLFSLAMIVPSIAVSIRRLHDINKSGWWYLIGLIPIVGLVLIAFYVMDSQVGENQYGPNPKGIN